MRKEITIKIDISKEQERLLDDIRWKHIDMDKIMQEELQDIVQDTMSSIIGGYCG